MRLADWLAGCSRGISILRSTRSQDWPTRSVSWPPQIPLLPVPFWSHENVEWSHNNRRWSSNVAATCVSVVKNNCVRKLFSLMKSAWRTTSRCFDVVRRRSRSLSGLSERSQQFAWWLQSICIKTGAKNKTAAHYHSKSAQVSLHQVRLITTLSASYRLGFTCCWSCCGFFLIGQTSNGNLSQRVQVNYRTIIRLDPSSMKARWPVELDSLGREGGGGGGIY